ncbi:YhdP family protein [Halomonas huangheensis]|uniref:YhdP central domain-containing protein n=1 Tax=Halomonas huangheensis TaxID=1178482 RepID=W1ND06_9GAMM|nr:AsmA-like C-terminal region-containing protein [Halomonas huangheensis]ALM52937.1 hypothetical protein AR456_12060 [Halomonas huangheensis]ERL53141.1 hypothetical protein BJB45_17855 [Halomonas huangheensis]
MAPFRLLSRWLLTLVAVVLALVALLLLVLRLSFSQIDLLETALVDMLESRFDAGASLTHIDGAMVGVDPRASIQGLALDSRSSLGDYPLLQIEHGDVRLDTIESIRNAIPVVERAHFSGVTLHLYQDQQGRWVWPKPARIPPELVPEGEFSLQRVDFWVGVLLRQRAWVDDLRLVLHGQHRNTVLHAPQVLMTADDNGNTHIEGKVFVDGRGKEGMQVVMSLTPGEEDAANFNARLQGSMQLDSLTGFSALLGIEDIVRFDEASGDVNLWGRWDAGRVADVRLDIMAPHLALNQSRPLDDDAEHPGGVVLTGSELRGQWVRKEGDDWESWFEGRSENVEWTGGEGEQAPTGNPIPRFWHVASTEDGWWANASGFELSALAAWRERLQLPEGLARAVDALQPRGQVTGLGFGQRDGLWQAQVAATSVEVSPWQSAPGGGPLKVWVEADGTHGRVNFVNDEGASMFFPEIFAEPMELDYAQGLVDWSYDGPRSYVSGRNLSVGWKGADVQGDFGLAIASDQRGGFGLSLDFQNVDAVDQALTGWLPMPLLRNDVDPDLAEWLSSGLAGRVPEGSLRLHVPLREQDGLSGERFDPTLDLELEVVDGLLPYAEGWPALTNVSGHLSIAGEDLEASVDHAESHGLVTENARVKLHEKTLDIEGPVQGSLEDLFAFIAEMPVEGAEAGANWQGQGNVDGKLTLSMPMDNPEALDLEVATRVNASRIEQATTGLEFTDVSGPLSWQQQGEQGGLLGQLQGHMLGGDISADLKGIGQPVSLSGTVHANALSEFAGLNPDTLISGSTPWRGQLDINDKQLSIDSTLQGLAIALPEPIGKTSGQMLPLNLDIGLGDPGTISAQLGTSVGMRWRDALDGQGQVWIGRQRPGSWPTSSGWVIGATLPRLDSVAWVDAIKPLLSNDGASNVAGSGGLPFAISRVEADTACLSSDGSCLGSLALDAYPQGRNWRASVDGSLMAGQIDYLIGAPQPLRIHLNRLNLDGVVANLTPEPAVEAAPGSLFGELDIAGHPEPFIRRLGELPAGILEIIDLEYQGHQFGPFKGQWLASQERLSLDPLSLSLGELTAEGELVWEASGSSESLTRSRLAITGGDPGTALEALGQQVAVRSRSMDVDSQLAWPGAPWQFALARSRGSLDVDLEDGSFANISSPSARVIGLLNVDNLLRRLSLDFSDVTGSGTAFDRVRGNATLYGGVLETQGPIKIDGPATNFTLEGAANLATRELELMLGVTVPVSNNLPLAAVLAGAPMVGGALFVADKLFGDAIDSVTRIHYQVRGPWTAPQISLESAQ